MLNLIKSLIKYIITKELYLDINGVIITISKDGDVQMSGTRILEVDSQLLLLNCADKKQLGLVKDEFLEYGVVSSITTESKFSYETQEQECQCEGCK